MSGRVTIASVKLRPAAAMLLCLGLLLAVCALPGSVSAAEPGAAARNESKRVLVLHSFGREFRPWSEYARSIKAEFDRQSPWPIDIQEHTLRILGGEKPTNIKYEPIGFAPPKYDWRELRRWGISESRLPSDSEIFRERPVWEIYRWQMLLIAAVILVQAGLISGLLYERRRRQIAEIESRQRLAELAHVNRYSAVGELTTSIAHELNQPLGSILTNAETAELMLKAASPDIDEIRQILADIRRDDQRASEVIRRLRSVLKKTPFEIQGIELNDTVRKAIGLVMAVAGARRISLMYMPAPADLHVKGDPVQLQQVVLNLIINALDAISDADTGKREVSVSTVHAGNQAEVRVADTGPGIDASDLANVFNPFFSTKPQGMGMGLAIARTIIEAHHGTIVAANQSAGGALFTIRLPTAR
jgi:signal transduction histidine kinase